MLNKCYLELTIIKTNVLLIYTMERSSGLNLEGLTHLLLAKRMQRVEFPSIQTRFDFLFRAQMPGGNANNDK